jgi:hypothetical protein
MFLFLLIFWIAVFTVIAAVTLPILRVFGVVDWEWKYILAPIWVPIASFFTAAFFYLFFLLVPILTLAGIIWIATP